MKKSTKCLLALLMSVVMITTLILPNYLWSDAAVGSDYNNLATATDALPYDIGMPELYAVNTNLSEAQIIEQGTQHPLVNVVTTEGVGASVDIDGQNSSDGDLNDIKRNSKATVKLEYTIANSSKSDSTIWSYPLPDSLTSFQVTYESPANLTAPGQTDAVGFAFVNNGRVYIVVTNEDWYNSQSDVQGTLKLDCVLDSSKIGSNETIDLSFQKTPDTSTNTTVTIHFVDAGSTDSKSVDLNGDTVTYTIKYVSTVDREKATLTDVLSWNGATDELLAKVDTNSFKLKTGSEWDSPQETIIPNMTSDGFTYELTNIKAETEYYISYSIHVTDQNYLDLQSITNKEYFTNVLENGDTEETTGDETHTDIKKNWIDKELSTTYDSDGKLVMKWKITVNPSEPKTNIAGKLVTDTFSDNQILNSDITITDANGNTIDTISKDSINSTGFSYTFSDDGTYQDTYYITYQTVLTESALESSVASIDNQTKINLNTSDDTTTTASVTDTVLTSNNLVHFTKEFQSVGDDNTSLVWLLTIKPDVPLTSFTLTEAYDLVGLNRDNIKVNRIWTDSTDIYNRDTSVDNLSSYGYTLYNPLWLNYNNSDNPLNEPLYVEVETPIMTDVEYETYKNRALLNYTYNNANKQIEAEDTYTPPVDLKYDLSKSGKIGEDNAVTWTVIVNDSQITYDDAYNVVAKIQDIIPEGMELVDESLTCTLYQGYIQYPLQVSSSDYSYDSESRTLTISAPTVSEWGNNVENTISGQKFAFTYKTRLTDSKYYIKDGNPQAAISYTNTVKMLDSENNPLKEASGTVTFTPNYLDKNAVVKNQETGAITYQVEINPDKLTYYPDSDVELVFSDALPHNVTLSPLTVSLIDETGNAVDGVAYSSETNTLTITVPDSQHFTLTYTVFYLGGQEKQEVSNSIVLVGNETIYSDETFEFSSSSSGTMEGTDKTFNLIKVDADSIQTTLPGAAFELYEVPFTSDKSDIDLNNAQLVETQTTDENGILTFGDSKNGGTSITADMLYYYIEKTAPSNYKCSETKYYFCWKSTDYQTISNIMSTKHSDISYTEIVSAGQSYIVSNEKETTSSTGSLSITKSFGETIPLTEAEKNAIQFTVTGPNDYSKTFTYADMTNGVLKISGLSLGTYTVTESNAEKDGYTLDITYKVDGNAAEKAEATVEKDVETTIELINAYISNQTSVTVTKAWEDDNNQYDTRPASVSVQLKANGVENGDPITLNAANNWTYTWSGLAENASGSTIKYTVEEVGTVTGYSAVVTGDATTGFIITNTLNKEYEDGTVTFKIQKYATGTTNPVVGAVFSITDKNEVKITATTDADGVASFTVQPSGNEDIIYTLAEDSAPTGYEKTDDKWTVTVKKDGTVTVKAQTADPLVLVYNWIAEIANLNKDANGNYVVYNNEVADIVITKTIKGDVTKEEAEGAISFTVTNSDGSYTKTIKLTDEGVTYDAASNKYTITLENLPVDTYTVEETTKDIDGKSVTVQYSVNGGSQVTGDKADNINLTGGNTTNVDFENTYSEDKGSLKIVKTTNGGTTPATAEFTIEGPNGYSKTVKYSEFTNGEYVVTDLALGTYTVTESVDSAKIEGYSLTVTGNGSTATVAKDTTASVTLINTYSEDKGSLKIVKTTNGGTTPATAEFTIEGPNGYSKTVKYSEFTNGEYVVTDLALGTYTVTESVDSAKIEGYSLTVTGNGSTATVAKDTTASVTLINTYSEDKGSLKIVKTTNGGTTPATAEFTIEGPNGYSKTVKYSEFTNGEYVVTDLALGTYTVTESVDSAKIEGYSLTVTGNGSTATVAKDTTASVELINTYSEDKGSLKIVKTTNGGTTPATAEFTIEGPNGYSKTVKYSEFTNGEYVVTDLALGTYTVTESVDSAKIEGYSLTVTGNGSTAAVVKDGTSSVTLINNYSENPAQLVITKTIKGDVTKEEAEGAISFTVTNSDGSYTKTIKLTDSGVTYDAASNKYTITLENLPVDTYTVEETTKDIDGNSVTVKYSVNGGSQVTGDRADNISLTAGNTTNVDFEDDYSANTGKIRFTKVALYKETCAENSSDTKPLEGVMFTLYTKDDATFTNPIATAASDSNGIVEFTNVPYGTYAIKETSTKAGYIAIDDVFTATVDASSASTYAKLDGVEDNKVVNDVVRTDISLVKVNESNTDEKIPNSIYALYAKEGAVESVIAKATTDVNGVLKFEGVFVDKEYTIKEVSAPDGSYVSESPITISYELNSNGEVVIKSFDGGISTVSGMATAYVDDNGNITWLEPSVLYSFDKVDEDGNPLSGATLRLSDADGNQIDEWVTDGNSHEVNGILTIGKTYTLHEVSAPEGYKLADDVVFTVSDDKVGAGENTVVTITMVDKKAETPTTEEPTTETPTTEEPTTETPTTEVTTTEEPTTEITTTEITTQTTEDKPEKPDGPKTGDEAPIVPAAIILFVSLAACGVLVVRKRKNEK